MVVCIGLCISCRHAPDSVVNAQGGTHLAFSDLTGVIQYGRGTQAICDRSGIATGEWSSVWYEFAPHQIFSPSPAEVMATNTTVLHTEFEDDRIRIWAARYDHPPGHIPKCPLMMHRLRKRELPEVDYANLDGTMLRLDVKELDNWRAQQPPPR